jgi:type III restriction enzyme
VQVVGVTDAALFKKALFYLVQGQEAARVCQAVYQGLIRQAGSGATIQPLLDRREPRGSTRQVAGRTARPVYATTKSHVNVVVADTEQWEQIAAKTLEDLPFVESYVKNAFLDFRIPYVSGQRERVYLPDFLVRCRTPQREKPVSLILEISGFSQDKAEKTAAVRDFWLPAINGLDGQPFGEWGFLEVAGDAGLQQLVNRLEAKVMGWPG